MNLRAGNNNLKAGKVDYFKMVDEKWYCFYYLLSGEAAHLKLKNAPFKVK